MQNESNQLTFKQNPLCADAPGKRETSNEILSCCIDGPQECDVTPADAPKHRISSPTAHYGISTPPPPPPPPPPNPGGSTLRSPVNFLFQPFPPSGIYFRFRVLGAALRSSPLSLVCHPSTLCDSLPRPPTLSIHLSPSLCTPASAFAPASSLSSSSPSLPSTPSPPHLPSPHCPLHNVHYSMGRDYTRPLPLPPICCTPTSVDLPLQRWAEVVTDWL